MVIHTLADLIHVGAAAQQLSATSIKAQWVQVTAYNGSAACTVGDSGIVAGSQGTPVPQNVTVEFPQDNANPCATYDLSQLYALVPNGHLSITYGAAT